MSQLRELRDRREAILASLEERGLLTEELRKAVQQQVWVTVLEVDLERKRISLSMKG